MEDSWRKFLQKVQRGEDVVRDWSLETLQQVLTLEGYTTTTQLLIEKGDVESQWKKLQGIHSVKIP